ncbi:hypothetical protein [Nocardia fluminea]|uniref:hypothetical protein n=1 Tax=Nocardia fluminea TaxID=134984 RepID=UPI003419BC47
MRKLTAALAVTTVYAALATLVFCTMIAETVFLYPNYFHDIPASLIVADEFTAVVSVGGVMRPLGAALMLTGVVAVAVTLWARTSRIWTLASMLSLISGLFLLSALYLWPRWTILFDDRALHTVDELRRNCRRNRGRAHRAGGAGSAHRDVRCRRGTADLPRPDSADSDPARAILRTV